MGFLLKGHFIKATIQNLLSPVLPFYRAELCFCLSSSVLHLSISDLVGENCLLGPRGGSRIDHLPCSWKSYISSLWHPITLSSPLASSVQATGIICIERTRQRMMMMTEIADHKRGSHHDNFLLANLTVDGGGCSSKRLKTGVGSTISNKERKDKIGERVASLQQLVSPFGKTDTASVLEEATEYIRFLHEQLQVLSAPYIRNTPPEMLQDAEYFSLRSRGLCLMPVTMTLRIARSNGADLWAPVKRQ